MGTTCRYATKTLNTQTKLLQTKSEKEHYQSKRKCNSKFHKKEINASNKRN